MLKKLSLFVCLIALMLPAFALEVGGNPKGKITLTEFFDYQCPHCRAMSNVVDGLIKANPNLRVVYRVVPIFGDPSWFTARASLAAGYQNKFKDFHQLMMYDQGDLSQQEVLSLAKQMQLNEQQLLMDMKKPAVEKQINENMTFAKAMQVGGVPTFLVGLTNAAPKFRFDGEVSYNKLQDSINQLK